MKNEYKNSLYEEIPWYNIPSDYRKDEECQKEFISQIKTNFSILKDVDTRLPTSLEMFGKKFGKEYSEESEIESWAREFLSSKGNKDKETLFDKLDTQKLREVQLLIPSQDMRDRQEIELERSGKMGESIKKEIGWVPIIRPSTIKGAGLGLFISGKCKQGTVIGLYPGMIYSEAKKIFNHDKNTSMSELMNTFVINGNLSQDVYFSTGYNRNVEFKPEKPHKLKKLLEGDDYYIINEEYLAQKFVHPFSTLQYVNHPPKRLLDNVLAHEMRIPLNFDRTLLPYVPNQYYHRPNFETKSFGLIRILVYVARRDLKDEEVFLNYRLNPNESFPDWYHSLNVEEDQRHWMKY